MAEKRPAAPVDADEREHTVFDAVPFAGAWRMMGDGDRKACFIGEFLLLNGIYQYNIFLSAVAGLTIIFCAVYMLRMYKKIMQGETNALTAVFTDITGSEKIVLGIICTLIIVIGVYPQCILHLSEASVHHLIEQVNQNKLTSVK